MPFMESRESIKAAVKRTVEEIKSGNRTEEFYIDNLCMMLKIAYKKGREDYLLGQTNDIAGYDPLFEHIYD